MSGPIVELKAARKTYGHLEALKGVDIMVEAGEVVALLGPNGAGKTTAINLMLGLRQPTAGDVRLFGLAPSDRKARSRTGVMLQESGVPGSLKISEIVDLFSSYYPKPLPKGKAIALSGLEEKAGSQVDDLSGGQRQRLYLALAVCGDPELLFLDEPTVGMDVEGRRGFVRTIEDFAARGKTILLTTHYLEEADELAERVIVIDRGVVIAEGSPDAIKARVPGKLIKFRGDVAAEALAGLDVKQVERTDGHVRILTNEPEAVLERLFSQHVEISELEVTGAALEDAFIALTGGGDR